MKWGVSPWVLMLGLAALPAMLTGCAHGKQDHSGAAAGKAKVSVETDTGDKAKPAPAATQPSEAAGPVNAADNEQMRKEMAERQRQIQQFTPPKPGKRRRAKTARTAATQQSGAAHTRAAVNTAGKIDNPVLAKVMMPVNAVPDAAVNTFIFAFRPLFPGLNRVADNERAVWPLVTLLSPVIGPLGGVMDAWSGYPFWNPIALDPDREYYSSPKRPLPQHLSAI